MEAEEQDFVPLSDTAQDLARDPELRRAIEHVVCETMPKPAPTLPPREIAPDSAARTAFRLKRLLPAASKDAVEIGTWIRFRESRKPKPVLAFTVANNQVLLERETVRFPRPLLKANNPCVFPTIEEVAPFLGAFDEFRAVMTVARFIGPAFALQPGDRAIVLPPAGTLARADVWITQIQDFVHQGSDRYTPLRGAPIEGKDVVWLAHVSPHYRGDDAIVYRGDDALVKGGARGVWHPLNLLKRHVLCPSPTPRILDRVRVTGAHRGMDSGVAWIVQIQDIPEIPSGQMIMVKGEDDEMFEIELSKLRREFRLGDEVVVARGDLKSRKGFVTVIHPGAVLEIFDSKESSEFVVAHTFRVRECDVDFLPFDADTNSATMFALNTGAGQYTVRSEVSHPNVPLPALPAPSLSLTRQEDYEAYYVEQDAQNAATATITSVDFTKPHTLVSKLKQLDQERTELTEHALRFWWSAPKQPTDALSTATRQASSRANGGRSSPTLTAKERAERLKRQELKRRKNIRGDTRGIIATVRGNSGAQFQVEIEKLVHAAWRLSRVNGWSLVLQRDRAPQCRNCSLAFAVSVFHAFGHEWACQLLYHPRKFKEFGFTNGEGCERFWHSISHLIANLRISGYHNRLYTLDLQIGHADEASLANLGEWIRRRRLHSIKKRAEATQALQDCGKPLSLLRRQWALQVKTQTQPLPRRSKNKGQQAVNAVMLLRTALKVRKTQVIQIRHKFLDAVEEEDPDAAGYEVELAAAEEAQATAERHLRNKEDALGVSQRQALHTLATSQYLRLRMNAHALKTSTTGSSTVAEVQARSDGTATEQCNDPDQKLYSHTESAVKRREPTISKVNTDYNKLCGEIAKLIQDGQAPRGAIAPNPMPAKGIWQLDVDDGIWEDIGLDDDDVEAATEPPPWLCDEQVRSGIKAILELDRCDEEDVRLKKETCSLREWFPEEWATVNLAITKARKSKDKYQLRLLRDKPVRLCATWDRSLPDLGIEGGTLSPWGPAPAEISACVVDAHVAARGEDRHYSGSRSDDEEGEDSGAEEEEFGMLEAIKTADVYRNARERDRLY
ncbi:hypothetical protein B0H17DRAFT_1147272 [Mycena rosella]|uniref:Uncharacterized protein n=1 Tax=Mycena rosella TaxID=1033263 RepID=A0AAD7CM15_MYCRO|nr:hypothetical protein B0H17DRAFT_1147272 [Mycena rosella]